MIKLLCPNTTTGDIRQRQPKSPGQRAAPHNAEPNVIRGSTTVTVWGNPMRVKLAGAPREYRCTRCGHKGHAHA